MHFVYPAHPLQPSKVDPMYADEMRALQDTDFTTSVCPDSVIHEGKPLRNIPTGALVVYRGWMLNAQEYQRFHAAVLTASASPLTSPDEYLAAHYCPNWYPLIAEMTPETRIYLADSDLEKELRALGWHSFFIKDYVKSLKTSRGSILHDPSEINLFLDEMKRVRGQIEGGICVRRVEAFLPESERRYFVLFGKPSSADGEVPELVKTLAARVASPFFSVDVVSRADAILRVVEIGDGQVSDLVGWSVTNFASIWK